MSATERYKKKLDAEFEDISLELDKLKIDLDRAIDKGDHELDEFKQELIARYERSKVELEQLRASGAATADQVALGVEMAYRDVRDSLSEARRKLGQ